MDTAAGEANSLLIVRVERRFFTIVQWFGLIVTAIALLGVAVSGVTALKNMTSSADEQIKPPTTQYGDFRKAFEAASAQSNTANVDTAIEQKEQQAAADRAEVDYLKKMKPHLDKIMENLTSYAITIDVGKPSAQAVGDFVRSNMKAISKGVNESTAWGYVEGLQAATGDLAADASRIAKMPADSSRPRWDQFLQWYTSAFLQQLQQEKQRVSMEQTQAAAQRQAVMFDVYRAGGAFAVFVLATILLVLLRIERNTRH